MPRSHLNTSLFRWENESQTLASGQCDDIRFIRDSRQASFLLPLSLSACLLS